MNLRSTLLRRAAPKCVKLLLLDELARATEAGFGSPRPRWSGKTLELRRAEYARFTADQARRILATCDPEGVEEARQKLRREAEGLGARVRHWLGLRRPADAMETLAALYGLVGIDMTTGDTGEILVSRCLFAGYFSEPVCGVVGALDEGLAAGMSGGGRLRFTERITGGATCCRASFDVAGIGR
jgi:hypothetical protein